MMFQSPQQQTQFPYTWSMNHMPQALPQYNVIQVNGENGANAFQMGPNSKVLLLDETAPLVWFVQTDGAGYKTVTPYSITPYKQPQSVDLNTIEERLTALEEKFNAQSHFGSNKQSKKQQYYAKTNDDTSATETTN